MDADEVKASTYTEIFEDIFPYYLSIGMSYEQFWCESPELVIPYRRADEIRKRRVNEELWLSGIYMAEAIASTVGNMFSKGSKYQYPSEPKPITVADLMAQQEKKEKARMESIKARFTAKALSMNAKRGTE